MRCRAGLLVWSIALMREGHALAAAAVYAVLVNMKHLFLCLAPLYLLYLLSSKCRCGLNLLEAIGRPDTLVSCWPLSTAVQQLCRCSKRVEAARLMHWHLLCVQPLLTCRH